MLNSHLTSDNCSISSDSHVTNTICSSFDSILYLDEDAILRVIDDGSGLLDKYQIATSGGNPISEFKDISNCKEIDSIDEANLLLLDDGTIVYHYLVDANENINANVPQAILNNLINIEWIKCKHYTITLLDSSNTLHCINFNNWECVYTQHPNVIDCKIHHSNLIILDTKRQITIYSKQINGLELKLPKIYRGFESAHMWLACIAPNNILEVYCMSTVDMLTPTYVRANILDIKFLGSNEAYVLSMHYTLSILDLDSVTITVTKVVDTEVYNFIDPTLYCSLNSNKQIIELLRFHDKIVLKTKETLFYPIGFDDYINLDSKDYFTNFDSSIINTLYPIGEYLIVKTYSGQYFVYVHSKYYDDIAKFSEFINSIKSIKLLEPSVGSYI